jgi:hypothetical protein
VSVEFALVVPVLILLALGVVEISRFVLLDLKLSHAATTVADLTSRERTISAADISALLGAVAPIVAPYDFGGSGRVIVSGITQQFAVGGGDPPAPRVTWQQSSVINGNRPCTTLTGGQTDLSSLGSEFGNIGDNAKLPKVSKDENGNSVALSVGEGQTIVASEVYFCYDSWLLELIRSQVVRTASFYRPRLGTLSQLTN